MQLREDIVTGCQQRDIWGSLSGPAGMLRRKGWLRGTDISHVRPFEMSVTIYQTARCHNQEKE